MRHWNQIRGRKLNDMTIWRFFKYVGGRKLCSALILFFASVVWAFGDGSQVDWPLLGFTQVVTNTFIAPVCITHAGDNSQRLFVTEQMGRVWIIKTNGVLAQPFLNITNRVISTGTEQGLLGLAFPPGFSTNYHFYVDYTRQTDGAVVISRFQLTSNTNVADTNSEQIILVIPKPYNNHNAGQLAFGPDGYLYIGVGDGGSEGDPLNNGQKTSTLLGKILRIGVESGVSPYAVPTNNPFVGNTNYAPEIWALGLRNPWRFSFDRSTGDLYIGDVGQGQYEEIDFQPAGSAGGQNYGWRIMEGPTNYNVPSGFTNFSALTLPVAWYNHLSLPTDLSAAVIGGYVYRGPSVPRMNGVYFYGDFMAGWIWGLKQIGTNWQSLALLYPPSSPTTLAISTFGEDDGGGLYLADHSKGKIYQIQDSGQVWTPTFSPAKGVINSNTVIVTCITTNAAIHYTTDGLVPTLSDPIVPASGIIQVINGATIEAKAFRSDLTPSPVTNAVFTLQVGTPTFNPPQGPITNGTIVNISTVTSGASIYYTTDGSTPTIGSQVYSAPIVIGGGTTLKALGVAGGFNNSSIQSITYALAQPATPVMNPPSGPITNGTSVTLASATPGTTIYYTLDGSTPTTNSSVYSQPLILSGPITLKAWAYRADLAAGYIASVFYGLVNFENTIVTTVADGLNSPQAICVDRLGGVYFVDHSNSGGYIRKVLPSGGVTNFILATPVGYPSGLAVDANGTFYLADSITCWIWKVPTNGAISKLSTQQGNCGGPFVYYLGQIAVDPAGSLYFGFYATLQKMLTNGTVTQLAGNGCSPCPDWSINVGVGIDTATNIYAATEYKIWEIGSNGSVQLYAGGANSASSDGPRLLALFQGPQDAAVDSATNVFVSDITQIRKISASGQVSTMAGSGISGYLNGRGSVAQFRDATGLCVDGQGNIYVTDTGNSCIRKISPAQTTPPAIQISFATTNQVTLSWPIWADQFNLEVSSTLSSSAQWTPVTNGITSSVNNFTLSSNIGATSKFYRLHMR